MVADLNLLGSVEDLYSFSNTLSMLFIIEIVSRIFYLLSTVDSLIFMEYQFSWLSWRVGSMNSSTHKLVIFSVNYGGKYLVNEFWAPWMCIFVQSTKICTHKNKTIHSIYCVACEV